MDGATIFFLILVGAVGGCRLVELRLSRRHQRALAEGGAAVLPELRRRLRRADRAAARPRRLSDRRRRRDPARGDLAPPRPPGRVDADGGRIVPAGFRAQTPLFAPALLGRATRRPAMADVVI